MVVEVQAEIIGIDRFTKNLKDLAGPPLAALLERASGHARKVATEGLPGAAANSIQSEVRSESARVYSLMAPARTISIEVGRKPGGPLMHPDALRRWVRRVGHQGNIFALARRIQRRGVKGRFFMRAAHQQTQNILPELLKRMGREIGQRFSR